MQLWQVREPQMQRLHLRSNHIPRYPRWFALDWYLEDHPRTGKWIRTMVSKSSPLRIGLFTFLTLAIHGLHMGVITPTMYQVLGMILLSIVVRWAQEFTIPVSPPKGFKDPSLSEHHKVWMQVTGWIVIMWHQPKQSAKKKANQQKLPLQLHWFALFDPNWPKADEVSPQSHHLYFFGFPSFFKMGGTIPGFSCGVLKKIALHTCINVQNAKNSKPRHNSSQQTSTNIIHQCQPRSSQWINRSNQSMSQFLSKLQEI